MVSESAMCSEKSKVYCAVNDAAEEKSIIATNDKSFDPRYCDNNEMVDSNIFKFVDSGKNALSWHGQFLLAFKCLLAWMKGSAVIQFARIAIQAMAVGTINSTQRFLQGLLSFG